MSGKRECSLCGNRLSGEMTRKVMLIQHDDEELLVAEERELCLLCYAKMARLMRRIREGS